MRSARIIIDLIAPQAPQDCSEMSLIIHSGVWDGATAKLAETDYSTPTSRYGYAYRLTDTLAGLIAQMIDPLLLAAQPRPLAQGQISGEPICPIPQVQAAEEAEEEAQAKKPAPKKSAPAWAVPPKKAAMKKPAPKKGKG